MAFFGWCSTSVSDPQALPPRYGQAMENSGGEILQNFTRGTSSPQLDHTFWRGKAYGQLTSSYRGSCTPLRGKKQDIELRGPPGYPDRERIFYISGGWEPRLSAGPGGRSRSEEFRPSCTRCTDRHRKMMWLRS